MQYATTKVIVSDTFEGLMSLAHQYFVRMLQCHCIVKPVLSYRYRVTSNKAN